MSQHSGSVSLLSEHPASPALLTSHGPHRSHCSTTLRGLSSRLFGLLGGGVCCGGGCVGFSPQHHTTHSSTHTDKAPQISTAFVVRTAQGSGVGVAPSGTQREREGPHAQATTLHRGEPGMRRYEDRSALSAAPWVSPGVFRCSAASPRYHCRENHPQPTTHHTHHTPHNRLLCGGGWLVGEK